MIKLPILTDKEKIERLKGSILSCRHCKYYMINKYPMRASCEPRNPINNKFYYFGWKIICKEFEPSVDRCPGVANIWTGFSDYCKIYPILEEPFLFVGRDEIYEYRVSTINFITGCNLWDKIIKYEHHRKKHSNNKYGVIKKGSVFTELDPLFFEWCAEIRRNNQHIYEDIEYHGNVKAEMIAFGLDYINAMKKIFPEIPLECYSDMFGIMSWYKNQIKNLKIIKEYPIKYGWKF